MSTAPRPNFFIVGAPKAGTSTLHAWLREHPQVFVPEVKEPDYFTHQAIEAQGLYYGETDSVRSAEAYSALFADAGAATAIGEASVSYLFYPTQRKPFTNSIPMHASSFCCAIRWRGPSATTKWITGWAL